MTNRRSVMTTIGSVRWLRGHPRRALGVALAASVLAHLIAAALQQPPVVAPEPPPMLAATITELPPPPAPVVKPAPKHKARPATRVAPVLAAEKSEAAPSATSA